MNNMGGCEMEFKGDDMMKVANDCATHIMESTDGEHKPMKDMMETTMSGPDAEEEKTKWFKWFKDQWDNKPDSN